MSTDLPWELSQWIHSLSMATRVKHPRRDFANGFLIAEILNRYFPNDVSLHSYDNVTSRDRKTQNWYLLKKFFKRHRVEIGEDLIQAIISAENGAVVHLLATLHNWLHGASATQRFRLPEKREPMTLTRNDPSGHDTSNDDQRPTVDGYELTDLRHASLERRRERLNASTQRTLSFSQKERHPPNRSVATRGGCIDWGLVCKQPDRLYFVDNRLGSRTENSTEITTAPSALQPVTVDKKYGQVPDRESVVLPPIFRRPKQDGTSLTSFPVVRSKHSTDSDHFNRRYWVLGKLGPDLHDPKLVDKKHAYHRVKDFAVRVNTQNKTTIKRHPKTKLDATPKPIPSRQRAIEYSKSIHPSTKKSAELGYVPPNGDRQRLISELHRLKQEHQVHKKRVQAISTKLNRRDTYL